MPGPRADRALGPALLFGAAGVLHFIAPAFFDQIVPPWVPNARMATLLSGFFEIAGAVGLLVPRTRRLAGMGLIALLVAVFPANVYMLQQAYVAPSAVLWKMALWVRLPVQALLIWWVWGAAVRDEHSRQH